MYDEDEQPQPNLQQSADLWVIMMPPANSLWTSGTTRPRPAPMRVDRVDMVDRGWSLLVVGDGMRRNEQQIMQGTDGPALSVRGNRGLMVRGNLWMRRK